MRGVGESWGRLFLAPRGMDVPGSIDHVSGRPHYACDTEPVRPSRRIVCRGLYVNFHVRHDL